MRAMIRLCWQLGISTTAFYVIGFLQDTEESIEQLIQFAVDLDSTYANFKILTPYPGTPQFKQLKPLVNETDWQKFDGYTLNFNHPVLTPRRARLMLGMCYSRFFLRPFFSMCLKLRRAMRGRFTGNWATNGHRLAAMLR